MDFLIVSCIQACAHAATFLAKKRKFSAFAQTTGWSISLGANRRILQSAVCIGFGTRHIKNSITADCCTHNCGLLRKLFVHMIVKRDVHGFKYTFYERAVFNYDTIQFVVFFFVYSGTFPRLMLSSCLGERRRKQKVRCANSSPHKIKFDIWSRSTNLLWSIMVAGTTMAWLCCSNFWYGTSV